MKPKPRMLAPSAMRTLVLRAQKRAKRPISGRAGIAAARTHGHQHLTTAYTGLSGPTSTIHTTLHRLGNISSVRGFCRHGTAHDHYIIAMQPCNLQVGWVGCCTSC